MHRLNLLIFLLYLCGAHAHYEPTWDSLDKRALPSWYDEAKFGIFIHWGVFSVPSYGSEWFWQRWKQANYSDFINFMKQNYPPTFTYQDFARDFKAEFYDADQWADIFANSGAKYVVLTTKHHEGYTLWPSKYSYSWNAVDLGPGRDLVGELATSVKAKNLTFGVYHSLYEWFNPLWNSDRDFNFTKQDFVNDKIFPSMKELVEAYEPSIFWSDGEAEALDTYWRTQEFLAWLYNESPVKNDVVVNDRWGSGTQCKHGRFYTCGDRFNSGVLLPHKWENCMTIDKQSWGFRRNADISDYLTTKEILDQLVSNVSCGGNLLLNVGPTKDGIIAPIFQERLQELGEWLKINGEAIYATKPWTAQNDSLTSDVWYTSKDSTVYATTLIWAENNVLSLASPMGLFRDTKTTAYLLGNEDNGALSWTLADDTVKIKFPDMAKVKSQWAYVVKIVPGASSGKIKDKYGLN